MSEERASRGEASAPAVLRELTSMVERVLGDYHLDGVVEVTMDTSFTDDLQLESIDLVALAGQLEARYGSQVNFAEFIADLELDEIIALTVGRLVDYVVGCLRWAGSGRQDHAGPSMEG